MGWKPNSHQLQRSCRVASGYTASVMRLIAPKARVLSSACVRATSAIASANGSHASAIASPFSPNCPVIMQIRLGQNLANAAVTGVAAAAGLSSKYAMPAPRQTTFRHSDCTSLQTYATVCDVLTWQILEIFWVGTTYNTVTIILSEFGQR